MSIKVWNRAKALIDDKSAMVPAPGNGSAMMVMSSSGQQPHYVRESKAGGYLCDDHCLGYKLPRFVPSSIKEGNCQQLDPMV